MTTEAFSAVDALKALRAQIEDRLSKTEEYRALKAIDKAIADVSAQFPIASLQLRISEPDLLLAQPRSVPMPMAEPLKVTPSSLMQRITANYPGNPVLKAVATA